MKSNCQMIHKSYMTYLPTSLPVYFYGMPDGKVYLLYARLNENNLYNSELEFVVAVHEDFTYDFAKQKIYLNNCLEINQSEFVEKVELPYQRVNIIEVFNDMKTYAEAQKLIFSVSGLFVENLEFQLN